MKNIILAIFIFLSIGSYGQSSVWVTRNLANYPLSFLSHKDSISNIYLIKNGKSYNGKDSISLKDSVPNYYEIRSFYKSKIETYILWNSHEFDGLFIVLEFVNNRLFQVNMFTKNPYYLSNFKLEISRQFKSRDINKEYTIKSDSTIDYGHKIVSYGEQYVTHSQYGGSKQIGFNYYEDIKNSNGYFRIYDKELLKRIPSWCGTGNQGNTWVDLEKYISKRKNKG